MIEGFKIVTPQEMARIESLAYHEGASEQTFVEQAGKALAHAAVLMAGVNKTIHLFLGKGNNAADALAAGLILLRRGFTVTAESIFPENSWGPLCKKMSEKFRTRGGKFTNSRENISLIIDGLVGTGFKGRAEGPLKKAIETANSLKLPILAVDIPSGLNATTGEVETVAIQATKTLFLGLPKIGFFLDQGWNHIGKLEFGDFGLQKKYSDQAKPVARLCSSKLQSEMPLIKRTRHKYEAGYVLAVAGSPTMPGAALLSCTAALHSGAGIVRLFSPEEMQQRLNSAPYELICEPWNYNSFEKESERAKALLIGPGLGRTEEVTKRIKKIFTHTQLPTVIDADALFFLAEHPKQIVPEHAILTPHLGEMEQLLQSFPTSEKCQAFVEEKNVTLVLKGAPTWIFHPNTTPLIVARGDPGMATAGTGDVLTGIIAALLAQGLPARSAAAIGVHLHAVSGEVASRELTPYCLTASQLITYLPHAFKTL